MSRLRIFADKDASVVQWESYDAKTIAEKMVALGAWFEQWQADKQFEAGSDDATVLSAYQRDIERLKKAHGYQVVDIVRLKPDNPNIPALRQKFLKEHIHSEDEVRFFVEGAGMFYLHIGDQVCELLCERGDLVNVPDGVPHWFDTGASPHFTAIRLFTNPEGWVAKYTGDEIAARFPMYDTMPTKAA